MTGLIGFASGHHAMQAYDGLLMLGTGFPHTEGNTIIQVEIRAGHLGRRGGLSLGVQGDVRETIAAGNTVLLKPSGDNSLKDRRSL